MKKQMICLLVAAAAAASLSGCGCSMSGQPKPTAAPKVEATHTVYGEYLLIDGFSLYTSPDGAYSIQIPEGSTVIGDDPANTTVTLAGTFANPDTISITKENAAQAIDTTAGLMDMLKNDNSIDITAFYVMYKDQAYEGYKYKYNSVDDPQSKGIVSVYFSGDGSAYKVEAKIFNGGDEANIHAIETVVDTFINYM